jgi:hypothetical protein
MPSIATNTHQVTIPAGRLWNKTYTTSDLYIIAQNAYGWSSGDKGGSWIQSSNRTRLDELIHYIKTTIESTPELVAYSSKVDTKEPDTATFPQIPMFIVTTTKDQINPVDVNTSPSWEAKNTISIKYIDQKVNTTIQQRIVDVSEKLKTLFRNDVNLGGRDWVSYSRLSNTSTQEGYESEMSSRILISFTINLEVAYRLT